VTERNVEKGKGKRRLGAKGPPLKHYEEWGRGFGVSDIAKVWGGKKRVRAVHRHEGAENKQGKKVKKGEQDKRKSVAPICIRKTRDGKQKSKSQRRPLGGPQKEQECVVQP